MRRVLNENAREAPEWLQDKLQPEWIKVVRIVDWLNGHRPADTPVSPFLALAAQAA